MRVRPVVVLTTIVGFWMIVDGSVGAQESPQTFSAAQADEIHGAGSWMGVSDARAARTTSNVNTSQRWNIDGLHFSDDRISGRIVVSGSPIIDSANVDGQLSGRGVTGKLLDDDGKELAEFDGQVTSTGASGTYRDRTGQTGQWQWEGSPPQLQRAQPQSVQPEP